MITILAVSFGISFIGRLGSTAKCRAIFLKISVDCVVGRLKEKRNNFLNDAGKSLELKRILRDKTAGPGAILQKLKIGKHYHSMMQCTSSTTTTTKFL